MIPLANPKKQVESQKADLLEAISKVFDNCQFIVGDNVKEAEDQYAAKCGARFGIGVNSGTDALVLALAACGVGKDDEVITVPYTFVATTEAILIRGARPVFVDIEPDTFNIDVSSIEAKITPRTRAILPVYLYGQTCDTEAISDIAKRHGLKVIADAAQAIGAKRNGVPIGKLADATCISFFPTKNLGACGDAGMIITDDPDTAETARTLRFHGMKPGTYYYERVGYNSRLDEIQAAVLNVKLPRLDEWNEKRRANAGFYLDAFRDTCLKLPVSMPGNYHIYHQFTIRYAKRDRLREMLAERGIGSAVYYPFPLHLQPCYSFLNYREGDLPVTEATCKEVLSLPVYPELTDEERNTVASGVMECLNILEN
ncbi:MAG: DegT/DnrJ/EryC1/StrS family aminotransferase [Abditibacteriota bacterium]|nr:DegT/DnrJ/EryC1/StrS family aminotransferase [Abditibacteriota bacterium]